jgi:fatty acid desaturase
VSKWQTSQTVCARVYVTLTQIRNAAKKNISTLFLIDSSLIMVLNSSLWFGHRWSPYCLAKMYGGNSLIAPFENIHGGISYLIR